MISKKEDLCIEAGESGKKPGILEQFFNWKNKSIGTGKLGGIFSKSNEAITNTTKEEAETLIRKTYRRIGALR